MPKKRTIVLLSTQPPAPSESMAPLGELRDVLSALAHSNIAPDGSGPQGLGERPGTGLLFGPGMVIEVPLMPDDPNPEVAQLLVTVTDEDFAWPVLQALCKAQHWKMLDADTGRTFGG